MTENNLLPTINWDADESADDPSMDKTLWSETRIVQSIREANEEQIDPVRYMKAQHGQPAVLPKEREFTTIFIKHPPRTLGSRLRQWLRRAACF